MKTLDALHFARDLRKNQTSAEMLLWQMLRKRQIHGMKFLRQFKIEHSNINGIKNYFIVDFYCHDLKFIIEVDGKIHSFQPDYDRDRQMILEAMGYNFFRIKNLEVEQESIITELKNHILKLIQSKLK
ncbi:MAG: endonuclease domain-containing protein [Saprospiraceae bacterium]|nr:endonuclease domain-containing protein [Saprospiraceae bacterium]